ncbi:hypothetical protein EATG_01118 [Escherichia coli H605]|uniref:Uncharacterized protein n=1 Tax=Escherichia coli H605 TaxID=656410 RepID=A0AAJ3P2A9_ECOLX|nr:hypothetical protein EATG_01118 [Escherichia coli H605]
MKTAFHFSVSFIPMVCVGIIEDNRFAQRWDQS